MARIYTVVRRDTLGGIARRFYGEPRLATRLAEYNGIRDPNTVIIGQRLEIPPERELREKPAPRVASATVVASPGGAAAALAPALAPPHGLQQVIATFGDLQEYVRDDGTLDIQWENEYMGRAPLPFAIPIAGMPGKSATRIYGHRKLSAVFADVFTAIQKQRLERYVTSYGGCFNFRSKRTSAKFSTHSWGIAIDINPETNGMGTAGNMNADVVEVFRAHGFKWGGDWTGKSKDPMHFQFCTGY